MIPQPVPPLVELEDATVVKDGRRVLDGLTLSIPQGEHTAVLGPNGSGKSVLLRLLTHQERPLAREHATPPVRVLGRDVWDVAELQAKLGIVSADLHHRFVSGNSEGWITGEAAVLSGFLVSHGILRYGVVTDEMRRRTADALAVMGVSHLARRRLNAVSSGEARRVMLARALVTAPPALVLDEPTTGLDVVARHGFMERVRHIARGGTTLLLITHHVDEIIPEIQRVVLLRAGRVVADGPKASVLSSNSLSYAFDAPLHVVETAGYHSARVDSNGSESRYPPDPVNREPVNPEP